MFIVTRWCRGKDRVGAGVRVWVDWVRVSWVGVRVSWVGARVRW